MRILSLAPLAGPGLETLRRLGPIEVDPWDAHVPIKMHTPEELIARMDDAEVLLVEADFVFGDVIREASSLRVIGTCRGDPVNVDIGAATEAGIPVLRAPGRNADAVAELALGLIIGLLRGLVAADDDVRAGRWMVDDRIAQQRYRGRELASLTVGLVGCGAVGRALSRKLSVLRARVLGYDPYADPSSLADDGIESVPLEKLLEASDVVSIHALVTDETRGLVGVDEIARMKPGALLVNTARYAIVQEAPMLEALRSGHLAGAAFDHFEGEFLPADHPLTSMPNVILTPHIGGQTAETIVNHTTAMAEGVEALLDGREPPNVVNPDALPAFFAAPR